MKKKHVTEMRKEIEGILKNIIIIRAYFEPTVIVNCNHFILFSLSFLIDVERFSCWKSFEKLLTIY